MMALIDADSLVHKSFYYVNSLDLSDNDKIYEGLEVIWSMVQSMVNEAEDELGVNFTDFHYFFTTCTNNFRKELLSDYKSNRPDKNPLIYKLLDVFMEATSENNDVHYDEELEADDLIPRFIKKNGLKDSEYCIFNLDKDLDQLAGFHFNYQKVALKDENNNLVLDDQGEKIMRYKGLKYITKKEAFRNFCKLMLIGDSADNIVGVKGIGEKKSEKLLYGRSMFGMWRVVVEQYLENDSRDKLELKVKLIRL